MERLPDQHGGVIQAPQGREVLHGRDNCLRRTEHQGSQDDPVGLLPVLQGLVGGEPSQASDHHSQGRPVPAFDRDPGVHVRRGGERGAGPASAVPQDRREA